MIDYNILAASWICAGTLMALGVALYKPADDVPPPFPVRPADRGGDVIPTPPRVVVEFSDGGVWTLPSLGALKQLTRIEQLLQSH